MSCMLRVGSAVLDIDKLLKINLKPDSSYRKGEYRTKKSTHLSSGARYLVSNADFDNFEEQKRDAISFLRNNANSIREIISISGIDNAELNFGIDRRDVPVQSDFFPAELLRLTGELGIGIMLSQYPIPEEEEEKNKKGEQEKFKRTEFSR